VNLPLEVDRCPGGGMSAILVIGEHGCADSNSRESRLPASPLNYWFEGRTHNCTGRRSISGPAAITGRFVLWCTCSGEVCSRYSANLVRLSCLLGHCPDPRIAGGTRSRWSMARANYRQPSPLHGRAGHSKPDSVRSSWG
jgi:hypothetical protein